jgi:hypothetical protein
MAHFSGFGIMCREKSGNPFSTDAQVGGVLLPLLLLRERDDARAQVVLVILRVLEVDVMIKKRNSTKNRRQIGEKSGVFHSKQS